MSGARSGPGGDSATRAALLDAAAQLMLEEGYAAVTTRKVAARANANPALVYYYFGTVDELFLAVFRRGAEANLRRLQDVRQAAHPLRAMWELSSEPHNSALTVEFIALANHRPAVRTELSLYFTRFRRLQEDILATALADRSPVGTPSPAALTILISGMSRILTMDDALGLADGHQEVRELIDNCLTRFEGTAPNSPGTSASPTSGKADQDRTG
ncbi:TetR/AcrR family transcriptional regulator [Streptomyces sp. NPDC048278]|uniref:TetR/AcrR family transcriptional regulator n=1 Tax=Streptomyces sp. NPDC048278 TaxID=3155809 RepID=UPI00342561AC